MPQSPRSALAKAYGDKAPVVLETVYVIERTIQVLAHDYRREYVGPAGVMTEDIRWALHFYRMESARDLAASLKLNNYSVRTLLKYSNGAVVPTDQLTDMEAVTRDMFATATASSLLGGFLKRRNILRED